MIRRMAEDLGVHHEALRNGIRQAEADAGERDELLTPEEENELAQLPREAVAGLLLRSRPRCHGC
ncbi:hypothetical protein RM812_25220 [Streptomyces sp. DSM 40712]|uniref:Uncharacterized protein n=1 Tax=Streptomyces lancefieldiae TaxID=3075520 RepID=A0ABU3AWP8_9ACTN|nr:hypothetical protein [Streptomyces sp. DSM 40712]